MRMRAAALILVLGAATAAPAAAQQTAPVTVAPLAVPRGRIHQVLHGRLTHATYRDVVLVTDYRPPDAATHEKWCYIFSPSPDGGTYGPTPTVARGLPLGATLMQCADVSGDGYDDLTFVTRQGVMAYLRGQGGLSEDARLILAHDVLVPPTVDRTAAGQYLVDANGDGRADLVLPVEKGLCIHLQQASGGFSDDHSTVLPFPFMARMYGGLPQPWVVSRLPYLHFSDANRDGRLDISVMDIAGSHRFVQTEARGYRGERLSGDLGLDAGISVTVARFGDWNADGQADAVVLRWEQRRVVQTILRVFVAGPDGRFPANPTLELHEPDTLLFPIMLDATGDGRAELLLYRVHFGLRFALNYFLRNRVVADVSVYKLTDRGAYDPAPLMETSISVTAFETGAEPVRAPADLNGDGCMDVIVGLSPDELGVFFGSAGTVLDTGPAWRIAVEAYGVPHIGDLNGDGRDDLVLTYPEPERESQASLVLSILSVETRTNR